MDETLFNLDEVEKETYFHNSKAALAAHRKSKKDSKFKKDFIKIIMELIKDMGDIIDFYLKGKYVDYLEKAHEFLERIEDYGFEIFVAGREMVIYYDDKLVAMRTGGKYESILFPSKIMNEMRRRVEKNCTQDYIKDLKRNIKRIEKYLEENPAKEENQLDFFE